ncbi:MAG: hypothetical protein M3N32_07735 [Actinomycetota bacterium]|nr:hypothetical protein [Actinomycetota bacterium]
MPADIEAVARGALYDLLVPAFAAAPYAAAPITVTYGLPHTQGAEPQEIVCMLGIEAPSEEAASLGNLQRDVVFDVIVAVKVYDPAGTGRSVDGRAFTLVGTVRSTVKANMSLNGTVIWAQATAARTDGPLPVQEGWIVIVEVPIRVKARYS